MGAFLAAPFVWAKGNIQETLGRLEAWCVHQRTRKGHISPFCCCNPLPIVGKEDTYRDPSHRQLCVCSSLHRRVTRHPFAASPPFVDAHGGHAQTCPVISGLVSIPCFGFLLMSFLSFSRFGAGTRPSLYCTLSVSSWERVSAGPVLRVKLSLSQV